MSRELTQSGVQQQGPTDEKQSKLEFSLLSNAGLKREKMGFLAKKIIS